MRADQFFYYVNNIFFIVRNCGFFLFVKRNFLVNYSYLARANCLRTLVSWQNISRAGIY